MPREWLAMASSRRWRGDGANDDGVKMVLRMRGDGGVRRR